MDKLIITAALTGAITVPTLLLSAGSDWVVKHLAQDTLFKRLSSPVKSRERLPGSSIRLNTPAAAIS